MVAHHAFAEVVEDHALAGAAFVGLGVAAVEEVGVPNEHIALGGMEIGAGEAQLADFACNEVLVGRIVFVANEPSVALVLVIGIEVVGQQVAAGVVVKGTVIGIGIFEGKPHAQHATGGVSSHVDAVAVRMLLAAGDEVDAVEQPGLALQQYVEQFEQLWAQTLFADVFAAEDKLGELVAVAVFHLPAVHEAFDLVVDGLGFCWLQKAFEHGKAGLGIGFQTGTCFGIGLLVKGRLLYFRYRGQGQLLGGQMGKIGTRNG